MEEKQTSAFSAALVPGIILGMILIVVDLFYYLIGLEYDSKIRYLSMLVMAGLLFWVMSSARDKNYGGFISYGKAFGVGFWATVIAAVIGAVYAYIYFTFINPGVMDEMLLKAEEEILNASPDMSDEQLEQTLTYSEMFMSPTAMVTYSLIGNLIFGTIFSLLIAIFVKRDENTIA